MIIESLNDAVKRHGLEIGQNVFEDILDIYNSNEEYGRLSNNYPVRMETIIEEVTSIPPFSSIEKKYYVSLYNLDRELVAVLDFLDEHSYKNTYAEKAIWVGLLQIDKSKQNNGLGKIIIDSLIEACKENGKEVIQLGVIKENSKALKFWKRNGFEIFTEVNNEKFELYLMKKEI